MATFGRTTTGAVGNLAFPTAASVISMSKFTLSESDALVSKMTVFSSVQAISPIPSSVRGVIYAVNGAGLPSALAGASDIASIGSGTNFWLDLPFSVQPTLSAGDYCLGLIANGNFITSGAATGTNYITGLSSTFSLTTNPCPSVITVSANQKAIYATYGVPIIFSDSYRSANALGINI